MSVSMIGRKKERHTFPHLESVPIQIKAILAATDLSEPATTALKIAARMAKRFESRLHVVHAVMPELYLADTTMLSAELQKIDMQRAEHELHQYTTKIPEVRTTLHEEIAVYGPAYEAIPALVERAGIDLIVMGSHGRGPATKLVLGSVAESVIRNTHCPAVVVGPRCDAHFRPLKSILLATDLPPLSLRAAQYATSLTRQFGSTLTVVHVKKEHTGESILDFIEQKDLTQLTPGDAEFRKHVHFEVPSGNAAEEILRIANECSADLIVMGAHEHGTLADHAPWATLSGVIREAPCPVLAVQPHSA